MLREVQNESLGKALIHEAHEEHEVKQTKAGSEKKVFEAKQPKWRMRRVFIL